MPSLCYCVSPCNHQDTVYVCIPFFISSRGKIILSSHFSHAASAGFLQILVSAICWGSQASLSPETAMKHHHLISPCAKPPVAAAPPQRSELPHNSKTRCKTPGLQADSKARLSHTNIRCLKLYIEDAGSLLVSRYGRCILSAPALT